MSQILGFVLGSSWLLYIGGPVGFGLGSNWLLYIGVPLIIGIWAQIRVTGAFSRWSKVRASGNITGAVTLGPGAQSGRRQKVSARRSPSFSAGWHA